MASIKFNLHEAYNLPYSEVKTRREAGKKIPFNPNPTRIYLVFILDAKHRIKVKTNYKILAANWNFQANRPKQQSADYHTIKPYLDKLENAVEQEYGKLEKQGVTWVQLKNHIKNFVKGNITSIKTDEKANLSMIEVYERYVKSRASDLKPLTLKKYNTLKVNIEEYQLVTGKTFVFDDIDLEWYEGFKNFIQNEKVNIMTGEKGLRNDTVAKYFENLKNFMKWAKERGYHTNTIYKHTEFKAERKPKNEIVTLNESELQKLHEVDLSNNTRYERVRDLFLFAVYTGQRWGDVSQFNKKNVENRTWIFEAQKTGKITRVPMVGFAAPAYNILIKYEFSLPKPSDVEFNRVLKKVGKIAGITEIVEIKRYQGKKELIIRKPKYEFMSSHMARRTCVTMLLEKGIPATTIMKLTGHTDLKTILKYENTSDDALVKALEGISPQVTSKLKIAN